jgi:predicted nucleic acid-binding protein
LTPPLGSQVVLDASVVLKWYVTEEHTEIALGFLADEAPAQHVPDLLYPEVGNILWKKVRAGLIAPDLASLAAELLTHAPLIVHPSRALLPLALSLATRLDRTVYDSLYVALAVGLDCPLVTADRRLANAMASAPDARVVWLGDLTPAP